MLRDKRPRIMAAKIDLLDHNDAVALGKPCRLDVQNVLALPDVAMQRAWRDVRLSLCSWILSCDARPRAGRGQVSGFRRG
jgi:hypothetical protein